MLDGRTSVTVTSVAMALPLEVTLIENSMTSLGEAETLSPSAPPLDMFLAIFSMVMTGLLPSVGVGVGVGVNISVGVGVGVPTRVTLTTQVFVSVPLFRVTEC